MPKGVIFDAGPIINFTLNNLLWVLPRLKHMSELNFYIPYGVKEELIDRPLQTKKYKLEALQILPYLVDGTIQVLDDKEIRKLATELDILMNNCISAKGANIKLVHSGELTALAACIIHQLDALVIDERTTRQFVETPSKLKHRMEKKLHTEVTVDKDKLAQIQTKIGNIRCLRSVELISVAYNEGIFCHYTYQSPQFPLLDIEDKLLEGLLWALKLNGCAISEEEVDEMYKIIKKTRKACRVD